MSDARKLVKVNIETRGWIKPVLSDELESVPVDAFRLANPTLAEATSGPYAWM